MGKHNNRVFNHGTTLSRNAHIMVKLCIWSNYYYAWAKCDAINQIPEVIKL